MSDYKGRVGNRISVPEVREAVRGDTERHYKKKRSDSQKSYDKKKKRKYQKKNSNYYSKNFIVLIHLEQLKPEVVD